MNESPPSLFFQADRSRAVVRALWRLLCAVIGGGLLLQIRPDWRLLWLTQWASCLALAHLALCLAIATLALFIATIRWLLFSIWPGPLGVEISAHGIAFQLGPLGNRSCDWSQIDLAQDIDLEMLDDLPDDAFVPRIRHKGSNEDLARLIQVATNVSDEKLTRGIRPYLKLRMGEVQSTDERG
jgi:hypothetical protein